MLIIDPATGAMWKLNPNFSYELKPELSAPTVQIMDINDTTEEMRKHMVALN